MKWTKHDIAEKFSDKRAKTQQIILADLRNVASDNCITTTKIKESSHKEKQQITEVQH